MDLHHLSDLHLGQPGAAPAMQKLAAYLLTVEPAAIVISGDLMDTPRRTLAQAIGRWCATLRHHGHAILAVPGNHDLHPRGVDLGVIRRSDRELWRQLVAPQLSWDAEGRWVHPHGYTIWGIDTQAGSADDGRVDLARGSVGPAQLAALSAGVAPWDVVVGHHRVWWRDPLHQLTDAAQLHAVLRRQGARLYLCGHQHEAHDQLVDGVRYVAAPKTTQPTSRGRLRWQVWRGDAGPAWIEI
jgi:3',5'-cyclic AMP phosphodiesterase CpdA